MRAAVSHLNIPLLPSPPAFPQPQPIPPGAEIVIAADDHILSRVSDRVPFLTGVPPVAQISAVAGAIQWSIHRELAFPYWYFGRMNYVVPVYLQNRDDITQAPDLIAPLEVGRANLVVRTLLEPHMPYPNVRVSVKRHDQLPPWLLAAWSTFADHASEDMIARLDRDDGLGTVEEPAEPSSTTEANSL